MPKEITRLEFRIKHRALTYLVNIDGKNVNLTLEDGAPRAEVSIYGEEMPIRLGETIPRRLRFLSEDGRLVERTSPPRAPGMVASPAAQRRAVEDAGGGGAAYQGGIFAPPSPRSPGEDARCGGVDARNGQPIGTPERPRRHGM